MQPAEERKEPKGEGYFILRVLNVCVRVLAYLKFRWIIHGMTPTTATRSAAVGILCGSYFTGTLSGRWILPFGINQNTKPEVREFFKFLSSTCPRGWETWSIWGKFVIRGAGWVNFFFMYAEIWRLRKFLRLL